MELPGFQGGADDAGHEPGERETRAIGRRLQRVVLALGERDGNTV